MANHGKNSSNYPHFFRIILPHNLQNGTLELPRNFVKSHGKCLLYNYVRLKLPTGAESKMELKTNNNNRASLHKGWPDFADKYSIQAGFFLVFKYKGGSRFGVRIYDMTTSEIQYPFINAANQCSIVSIKEAPNQIQMAKAIKCNDSSFTVVMRKTHVEYFYMVSIPKAHHLRYLNSQHGKQAFLVHGLEGQETTWAVKIYVANSRSETRFSSGWKDFVVDNNLQEGDSCVFELISHVPNYYKVTISRKSRIRQFCRALYPTSLRTRKWKGGPTNGSLLP
ncbi:hypothetical protein V2J09_006682 [Rumex salicifolius]